MRKISFEENISWAAGHLYEGRYYDKFKQRQLTYNELSMICWSYRKHRYSIADSRKWYQFKLKRCDRNIIAQLDILIRDIYKAQMYGHPFNLSMYGGPDNTKVKP